MNRPASKGERPALGVCICFFAMLVLTLTGGCAGGVKTLYPPASGQPTKTIHVVSHGWHTGVVVQRADFTNAGWGVLADFPGADYLEFGWGDEDYYTAERGTVGLALKALFWPTPSVMHVTAVRGGLPAAFPASEIIQMDLSPDGFARMAGFIEGQFLLDETSRVIPFGPGLYGGGKFYRAKGWFHGLNTCNQWVARALRSAGCPITPIYAVTAGNVMFQTRKFGVLLQEGD